MYIGTKQNNHINIQRSINITQSLLQSIKLLELSDKELNDFVDKQAESNPLLEIDYNSQYLNYNIGSFDCNQIDNIPYIENNIQSIIKEQILFSIKSEYMQNIAYDLLNLLDDNGYIEQELLDELPYKKQDIDIVLNNLQKFDPPGIFARNIAECLIIQLKRNNQYNDKISKIILNLKLFQKSNKKYIMKKFNLNDCEFREILSVIKSLNPKPVNLYYENNIGLNEIDVFLKENEFGDHIIELNNIYNRYVFINKDYCNLINDKIDKQDKRYLIDHLESAKLLLKAISIRKNTLYRVVSAIISRQKSWIDKGLIHLEPLRLKDIANDLDIHESTVSRIVKNKYINTKYGNFSLKYFFSKPAKSDNHSSVQSIKYMIKELVEKEESALSDSEISNILTNDSIYIARRTVAKYREELNIATSTIRKRDRELAV